MKKFNLNKTLIIVAAAIILTAAVGGTLAFVFTQTEKVENEFTPSKVSCAVIEGENSPVSGAVVNTGSVKKDVKIKNTGDADAFIRVAIVVNWANEDGTRFWSSAPVSGVDYTMTLGSDGNWEKGDDGFYYFKNPVAPGNTTDVLIAEAKLNDGVTPPTGSDGTNYYLSVEIVASAIQSSPTEVAESEWGFSAEIDV